MSRDEVLVACRDAALTFGRGSQAVVAVHGANLEIGAGDRLAIVGPSGSGKSSLLHLLAGLEQPTGGTVTRVPSLGPYDIGLVFQGDSLIPALDVVENTALPLILDGRPEDEAHEAALASLALVDAADLADRLPEEISGGPPAITLGYYAHFMPEAGSKGRTAIDGLLGRQGDLHASRNSPDSPQG